MCLCILQVLLNMLEFGMNPQRALDAPRIRIQVAQNGCIDSTRVEEGVSQEVIKDLQAMGHYVYGPVTGHNRWKYQFGRGHVVTKGNWWENWDGESNQGWKKGVLWAGSDPRGDGIAMAQI